MLDFCLFVCDLALDYGIEWLFLFASGKEVRNYILGF